MALRLAAPDGVKVYTVSGGNAQPHWVSEKKQRSSLKKDDGYRRRIELIQDLEFPEACQRLKLSPDGQFLVATGIHPPRVRVFELAQLSLKFERHLGAGIVDFQILTDDFSKLAFLCDDRSICFHARFGAHHRTRVPTPGRDLAYASESADLLVVGSAPEVYRLNLSEGRFLSPLATQSPAVNACGISPLHGLLACAGETGLLECFDVRAKATIGCFNAASAAGAAGEGLTAVRFDDSGLQCAVGTSNGLVALYDLRMSRPTAVRDHMYGQPILDIKFHQPRSSAGLQAPKIVSADCHAVRVWEANTGKGFTTIEGPDPSIRDVLLWPDSGLLMLGCDAPQIQAYFVPALGPAPGWCSFLESLTEELEENATPTLYDDYRFITNAEVTSLGLEHMKGTSLLRAYMHGFLLHQKLWQRARALAQDLAPAALRQQRISDRLEAERASRITLVKKLPKVNAATAARLLASQKEAAGPPGEAQPGTIPLMADSRFRRMFEDPAYAIDEHANDFKSLHPNSRVKRSKTLAPEALEAVSASEGDDRSDSFTGPSSADDAVPTGGSLPSAPSKSAQPSARAASKGLSQAQHRTGVKRSRMYAARDDAGRPGSSRPHARQRDMLLAERAVSVVNRPSTSNRGRPGGNREITFTPRMHSRGAAHFGGSDAADHDRNGSGSGLRGRGRGRSRGGVGVRQRAGQGRGMQASRGSKGRGRSRGRSGSSL